MPYWLLVNLWTIMNKSFSQIIRWYHLNVRTVLFSPFIFHYFARDFQHLGKAKLIYVSFGERYLFYFFLWHMSLIFNEMCWNSISSHWNIFLSLFWLLFLFFFIANILACIETLHRKAYTVNWNYFVLQNSEKIFSI